MWACGGEHGEYELIDAGGTRHPKGYSLWHGQHNAEYFGEYVNAHGALVHQVMMFDNQYEQGRARMLVVEIDEAALSQLSCGSGRSARTPRSTATTSGAGAGAGAGAPRARSRAPERQPARLVLGHRLRSWPSGMTTSTATSSSTRASSRSCATRSCPRGARACRASAATRARATTSRAAAVCGTSTRVERFSPHAARPLALVRERRVCVHNVFKQQNVDVGYYVVKDTAGATLADGEFGFKAHWTPANVTVVPSGVTLAAAWNQSRRSDRDARGHEPSAWNQPHAAAVDR